MHRVTQSKKIKRRSRMGKYRVIQNESLSELEKDVSEWLALRCTTAGGISYFLGEYHQAIVDDDDE